MRAANLVPSHRNARTHSKKQIRQIADSIREFGFINPVVVDRHRRVVAGHGRLEAARLLGLTEVPTISVAHLSEAAVRAYALADNRLAEKAGWSRELLAIELKELTVLLPEIELELDITGFEAAEVDALLLDLGDEKPEPADEVPATAASPVARVGDLFCLGPHRLLVGDARRLDCYERLMRGERAAMAVLDPPFNVKVQGHVGGRGRIKHREFVCASGEMSAEEFTAFLTDSLGLCANHSTDGAIHFVFMDWRHMGELLAAGEAVYSELKNLCVWTKSNAGQGSFYRSQHELVFVFKHGMAPHLNTFELGQHGRNRSNVWPYAGVNSFRAGRLDELKLHPTVKPVALVADAIRDCSRRGDIVLDAFAGSGTTIVAAERIGRRAYCLELDPLYADVSIRRWQAYTNRDAILEGTGETFAELAAARSSDGPAARSGMADSAGERAAEPERNDGKRPRHLTARRRMKRRRPRRKGKPQGDYEIGYCRPPKATQFQPGQSGNPRGPGKRPRSIGAAADKALASKVVVVDQHGRRRSVRAEDLIMRRFRDAALNGDVKAAAFLMDRAEQYRSAQPETTQAPELSPQDIEILESLLGPDPRARKRKPSTRRKPPARQKPRGEEPASGVRPA